MNEENYVQAIYGAVRRILQIEEIEPADFALSKKLSDRAIDDIHSQNIGNLIDEYIYKFLEDYDIREKDPRYGRGQREIVRKHLPAVLPD